MPERGVGAGVHRRAVHLLPYYRDTYDLDPFGLPVASDVSERTRSLPLSPRIGEGDQERVAGVLCKALV